MISETLTETEFPGYKLTYWLMSFNLGFFILFYTPHPIFWILHFFKYLTIGEYRDLQITYMSLLCLLYTCTNTYLYYQQKVFKRRQRDHQLTHMFPIDDS
jgi:hypothetical protein